MNIHVEKQQADEKREAILLTATRLFNRFGIAGTSLQQVATDQGITQDELLEFFADKGQLVFHCYKRGIDIYDNQLQISIESGIDALETIRRIVRDRLRPSYPRMIVFSDLEAMSSNDKKIIMQGRYENLRIIEKIIKKGIKEGSISSNNSLITSTAILSVLDWLPVWYTESDYYTRQEAVLIIDDLVTHGMYRRDRLTPPTPPLPNAAKVIGELAAQEEKDKERNTVLRIAAISFNEKGVSGTSMEQIAHDAGVSKHVIHKYASDLKGLLFLSTRRCLMNEVTIGNRFVDLYSRGLHDRDFQSMRGVYMTDDSAIGPKTTYNNIGFLDPKTRKNLLSDIVVTIRDEQASYQERIDRGIFRKIDTYFAQRLQSSLRNCYPLWKETLRDFRPESVADNHAEFILFGLKPRSI